VHPPGTLEESLPQSCHLGPVDASTLPAVEQAPAESRAATSSSMTTSQSTPEPYEVPALEDILNISEFEPAAQHLISRKGFAYYYSAADDLHSKHLNSNVYSQILLRPRIFVDCTRCDTSITMFGHKVDLPIYVAPAAMARLAHPTGEQGIAQACATWGACQIISNNASMTPEQIVAGAPPSQVFGWQLYVQTERSKSEIMLARIAKLPQIKFIVLTLDAPVPGKREDDERAKNVGANLPIKSAVQDDTSSSKSRPEGVPAKGGIGASLFAGTAPDLTWASTLPWLKQHTSLPIVLKGLQTHEDAFLTSLYAPQVRGIMLSNHGGRAADTAPPSIHTLLEIRKYCPQVLQTLEVYIDGGIKRGTDVVKALALGARGVGLGRAALYGLGVGGPEGVSRVFEILKAETETAMRLLGCERIEELGLQHVNTRAVERDIYDGPAWEGMGAKVGAREKARL
jgi:L-lactate dehydrogenase (cytochrome)